MIDLEQLIFDFRHLSDLSILNCSFIPHSSSFLKGRSDTEGKVIDYNTFEFNLSSIYLSNSAMSVMTVEDSENILVDGEVVDNLDSVIQVFKIFAETSLKDSLEIVWVNEKNWDLQVFQTKMDALGYHVEVQDW